MTRDKGNPIVFEQYTPNVTSESDLPALPGFSLPPKSSKVWGDIYTHYPIQVQIKYTLKNPVVGVRFCSSPIPHVYSWSSFFSGKQEESLCNGTRTWVPCVDNDLERCVWELEIIVPSGYEVRGSGELVKQLLLWWFLLIVSSPRPQRTAFQFKTQYPLAASAIGFVAGQFKQSLTNHSNHIFAAVLHTHHYMLSFSRPLSLLSSIASTVVEKAVHFLNAFFTSDKVHSRTNLPSVVVACVNDAPEPYCVLHNLILLNRNELIGEKDYAHHAEFYHMICMCLAYQFYGVLVQPLSWSDCWIPIGVSSYLAMQFVRQVAAEREIEE